MLIEDTVDYKGKIGDRITAVNVSWTITTKILNISKLLFNIYNPNSLKMSNFFTINFCTTNGFVSYLSILWFMNLSIIVSNTKFVNTTTWFSNLGFSAIGFSSIFIIYAKCFFLVPSKKLPITTRKHSKPS